VLPAQLEGETEVYKYFLDEVKEGDGKTQIYLDISSIKNPKDIKNIYNQHCRILVDEPMQLKFVDFFETKNRMVEPMCEQFMGTRLTLSRWTMVEKT
jgi:hypothetical protein